MAPGLWRKRARVVNVLGSVFEQYRTNNTVDVADGGGAEFAAGLTASLVGLCVPQCACCRRSRDSTCFGIRWALSRCVYASVDGFRTPPIYCGR
jgi:hypothetical protein